MKTRLDATGLFWQQKPKELIHKSQIPTRTWEEPSYLPYLEDARRFNVSVFTIEELIEAKKNKEVLVCDIELFFNYLLVAFASYTSGKVFYLEKFGDSQFDGARLRWILESFQICTFNGNGFDVPIMALAIDGLSTQTLKHASNELIQQQMKPWMVLRKHKVELPRLNHIDLIEVAPLTASLKIYGGRLHVPKMQELPFQHELVLSEDQICVVRWYCINSDLTATAFLLRELTPQLELRTSMSQKYSTDLRSKSDAQIAEAVIIAELTRLTGVRPERVDIAPRTTFQFKVPSYVTFELPQLKEMLAVIAGTHFVVNEKGEPVLPKEISALKLHIGEAFYQMGIGGLHSCEVCAATYANAEHILVDRDVASYYPAILLNQGLFPKHLGPAFTQVYKILVRRRLEAKKVGNKVEADSLKICVNGGAGKFGSKWSVLYAPDLLLQITISGQLSLLMLIERLEAQGIVVKSANTDGLLIHCHKAKVDTMNAVVKQWEAETGFVTEETPYVAVYSRDINSYVAIKPDGKVKIKGYYAERGSAGDSVLSKNPVNLICRDALVAYLIHGTPISTTIRSCKDIRRFVSVRTVKGGAVKDGQYLGKAIRWYQSNVVTGDIIYALNGNKVPNSENCRPCMELPAALPDDVDFGRYEAQTYEMLKEIGYK